MKILIINEMCGTTSTGRLCACLADELTQKGHVVKIAFGRDGYVPSQYKQYAVRVGNSTDVYLHALKARLFDAAGFGSKSATYAFIKWVEQFNPDIIHLHNLHGYYINIDILFRYLKTCKKKVLWTLHDCWAFTGHSAYCDSIGCDKWIIGCDVCPLKQLYPKSFMDRSRQNWCRKRNLFSGIDNLTIITPSEWLKHMVEDSFLNEYPIISIHNGIDTAVFSPGKSNFKERKGLKNKKIVLGVATVWNNLKGLEDFVQLSNMLDNQYRIVIVGSINRTMKRLLPNNLIHIERTNNIQEMAEIYRGADVFVNLTYCDTYPTTNLEAIACGKKIITYKTGGSTEIAERYKGVVIERGDLNGVVQAIKRETDNDLNLSINALPDNDLDFSLVVHNYLNLYIETRGKDENRI